MRTMVPILAFSLSFACGTSSLPSANTSDASPNPGTEGGSTADGGACNTTSCANAGFACDPGDGRCKPDGKTSNVGATCTRTGPGDPSCGTDTKAVCNDLLNDGFPGGYCTFEPCTTAELCPIGASCGQMGGESPSCFLNCKSDADCRAPDYKCQPMDQLAISGAAKSVCHLAMLPCLAAADCPSSLPKCTNKVCGQ